MSTTKTFTTTVHGATRRSTTKMGNTVWTLHTAHGDHTTAANSASSYSAMNYQFVTAAENQQVTITLNGRGRITEIHPDAPEPLQVGG